MDIVESKCNLYSLTKAYSQYANCLNTTYIYIYISNKECECNTCAYAFQDTNRSGCKTTCKGSFHNIVRIMIVCMVAVFMLYIEIWHAGQNV